MDSVRLVRRAAHGWWVRPLEVSISNDHASGGADRPDYLRLGGSDGETAHPRGEANGSQASAGRKGAELRGQLRRSAKAPERMDSTAEARVEPSGRSQRGSHRALQREGRGQSIRSDVIPPDGAEDGRVKHQRSSGSPRGPRGGRRWRRGSPRSHPQATRKRSVRRQRRRRAGDGRSVHEGRMEPAGGRPASWTADGRFELAAEEHLAPSPGSRWGEDEERRSSRLAREEPHKRG